MDITDFAASPQTSNQSVHNLPEDIAGMTRENTACRYCGISYLTYHQFYMLQENLHKARELLKQIRPDLLDFLTEEFTAPKIPSEIQARIAITQHYFLNFRHSVHSNFAEFHKILALYAGAVKETYENYCRRVNMTFDVAQCHSLQAEIQRAEDYRASAEAFKTMLDKANEELVMAHEILRSSSTESDRLKQDNIVLQQAIIRSQVVTNDHERLRVHVTELTKKAMDDQQTIASLKEELRKLQESGTRQSFQVYESNYSTFKETTAECCETTGNPSTKLVTASEERISREIKSGLQRFQQSHLTMNADLLKRCISVQSHIDSLTVSIREAKSSLIQRKGRSEMECENDAKARHSRNQPAPKEAYEEKVRICERFMKHMRNETEAEIASAAERERTLSLQLNKIKLECEQLHNDLTERSTMITVVEEGRLRETDKASRLQQSLSSTNLVLGQAQKEMGILKSVITSQNQEITTLMHMVNIQCEERLRQIQEAED